MDSPAGAGDLFSQDQDRPGTDAGEVPKVPGGRAIVIAPLRIRPP